MKQLDRHPVKDKISQKGKQTAFSVFQERYKRFEEIILKTGNYFQLPIDIGVCGVNLFMHISWIIFHVLKVYRKA